MTNMSHGILVTGGEQGVGAVPDGRINLSLPQETEMRLEPNWEPPTETAISQRMCLQNGAGSQGVASPPGHLDIYRLFVNVKQIVVLHFQ